MVSGDIKEIGTKRMALLKLKGTSKVNIRLYSGWNF